MLILNRKEFVIETFEIFSKRTVINISRGQASKETVVLRRWEYYKIIWFYQLG